CAHLFRKTGILRPASDERQAGWFKESEAAHPDSCSWMEAEAVRSRWPAVSAQFGGLFIHRAGRLRLSSLVEALLAASSRRACEVRAATPVIDFRESSSGVTVVTESGTVRTRTLLLCTGADFTDFEDVEAWPSPSARLRAALSGLALHPLKGQTITVTRPESLRTDLPCLAGSGYVVPYPDQLVLGSTYHHAFDDRNPTDADTREILEKTNRMLPGIGDAEVISADAGVRMTVPGTRLPLVGPVAGSNRVWVFTGLGSKGLLMGALVGRSLPDYLNDPSLIPEKLKVR
ncbi:MAG: NAD(P)/FAD-dependent oxidoreductase, partial [Rhodothermia bacterium]